MKVIGFETVAPPATEGERIRDLAKLITTRAQLETVLADVHPDLQTDVRLMLESLVNLPPEG